MSLCFYTHSPMSVNIDSGHLILKVISFTFTLSLIRFLKEKKTMKNEVVKQSLLSFIILYKL